MEVKVAIIRKNKVLFIKKENGWVLPYTGVFGGKSRTHTIKEYLKSDLDIELTHSDYISAQPVQITGNTQYYIINIGSYRSVPFSNIEYMWCPLELAHLVGLEAWKNVIGDNDGLSEFLKSL